MSRPRGQETARTEIRANPTTRHPDRALRHRRCSGRSGAPPTCRRCNYSKPVSDDLIAQIERRRPRARDQLNRIWYGYHNRQPPALRQHMLPRGEPAQRLIPWNGRVPLVRGNPPCSQGESLHPTVSGRGGQGVERPRGIEPQAIIRPAKRPVRVPGLPHTGICAGGAG